MANLLLSGVYNHFLTTYASKEVSQSDTHKREELRNIYKSIVKINQESPLYLLPKDTSTEVSAIGLKEEARHLQKSLSALVSSSDQSLSGQKTAYSTDENAVTASYVGAEEDTAAPVSLHVDSLAANQINTGTYLPDEKTHLDPGSYIFNARVADQRYELQFSIGENDSNRDVQSRIARLINKAGVRLDAEVLDQASGESALQIRSQFTGLSAGKNRQFEIYDALTGDHHGIVPYFGLDQTSQQAVNAQFVIDGAARSSSSNHFTINSAYEVTLHQINEDPDESVSIGIKNDGDAMIDNIHKLVNGYNSFINNVSAISSPLFQRQRILSQMTSISAYYRNELEPLGFQYGENGQITLDDQLLTQNVLDNNGDFSEEFRPVRAFVSALSTKTNEVTLDPMKFTDRPIVNYKNPGRTLPNPYITSEYSGMLFNNYC